MPSTLPTPAPDLAQPVALAAFLRGVERRAAVLAELQTGDPTLGDAALTRAMAAFREAAVDVPMADWPRLFWSVLLDQPALRRATRARPPGFLPTCTAPLRAALLLRVAAGLDEPDAAAVLRVPASRLRQAVASALACGGSADAAGWVRLQADVQQRVRGLSTERGLRLARMREAALAGPADRFFHRARPSLRPRLAVAAAALTLLALGVTFRIGRGADAPIRISPLPAAGAPASRYAASSGLIAHPDFDLLADPDRARMARDAAFLAWYVGHATPAPEALPADTAPETPSIPDGAEGGDAP